MFLIDLRDDIATVALNPVDCLRLAHACRTADYALLGAATPADFFGVPAGSTASLPLSAHYQALAVAFETAAYAGEASYTFGQDEREHLSLAHLEERYGGRARRGQGGQ